MSSYCSYLVVVGSTVVVYSAATSEAVGECKHDVRVNSACFSGGEGSGLMVATCADDKTIRFFRADGATLLVSVHGLLWSCSPFLGLWFDVLWPKATKMPCFFL